MVLVTGGRRGGAIAARGAPCAMTGDPVGLGLGVWDARGYGKNLVGMSLRVRARPAWLYFSSLAVAMRTAGSWWARLQLGSAMPAQLLRWVVPQPGLALGNRAAGDQPVAAHTCGCIGAVQLKLPCPFKPGFAHRCKGGLASYNVWIMGSEEFIAPLVVVVPVATHWGRKTVGRGGCAGGLLSLLCGGPCHAGHVDPAA